MRAKNESRVKRFFDSRDTDFINACQSVPPPIGKLPDAANLGGIPPTRRQAAKWLRHTGAAYKYGRN